MSRPCFWLVVCFLPCLYGAGLTFAEENPKVICAARAGVPPILDGVLDDACWKKAEAREDFIPLGAIPLDRTMAQFAYDDQHLYLGVECFWRDASRLREQVAVIRGKAGSAKGFVGIGDFTNNASIELFLDPGATMRNHYQILFNAAGQICGQFKGNWDPFSSRPACNVQLTDRGWTAEMVFPDQGIRKGDLLPGREWGMNLVRNDEVPVSIWKEVGAVFNAPNQFGRLIVGDYETWWREVWDEGMGKRCEVITGEVAALKTSAPLVYPMYQEVRRQMTAMEATRRAAGLTTRDGFLKMYATYTDLYRLFHRLDALCSTAEKVSRIERQ